MIRYVLIFLLGFSFLIKLCAQCDDYIVKGSQIFHANDIRTVINTGGDMFWDLDYGKFLAPYTGSNTPTAAFAAAVWMGAYDDVGNLKLAAQTYRNENVNAQEYAPGPLVPGGSQAGSCEDWDQVWSVSRHEILLHIHDYEADGQIDSPQRSVFAWPGIGNDFFEAYNGFSLPDFPQGFYPHEYAPFRDLDMDGLYEPDQGEYPLPAGLAPQIIPDQITWNVFNDSRIHHNSGGGRLNVEVQQTCFAFYCDHESVLDATLFIQFNIANRGISMLDSFYFGLWMDPDLGCYTDDYFGSAPADQAFMVYNADSIDGTNGNHCDQGVLSYLHNPPVLSGSFLDGEMSRFAYYVNSSFGNWPDEMIDPKQGASIEFYRLLSGHWRDGSPICYGGSGYDSGPQCSPVQYAFSGDPNDTMSWAMSNLDLDFGDRRFIVSDYFELLDIGETESLTMSFALHLDTLRDHLGNVQLMYDEVPVIREYFNQGFSDCVKSLEPCIEDCVWPGDANHDGIANHLDVLELGLAFGRSGPIRNTPLSWAPHAAEIWESNFLQGLNMKHADMNGDGDVDYVKDSDILRIHYGLTHSDYQPALECNEGNEIIVDGGFALVDPISFNTRTTIELNSQNIDSLYGLAFSVIYDTAYFGQSLGHSTFSPFDIDRSVVFRTERPGVIEYAATCIDGLNVRFTEDKAILGFLLLIKARDLIPGKHDTTTLCIANVRGVLADGSEIPLGANSIQFIFLEETTAIDGSMVPEVKVYPNPSNGKVYTEVPEEMIDAHFDVYRISGEFVDSGRIQGSVHELQLNDGIFTLVIRNGEMIIVEKIVIIE